jgi:uncharacterized protein (TIGR03067 family)
MGAQPRDNEASRDKRRMEGTWEAVAIFARGEQKQAAGHRLVIKDDRLSLMTGDREYMRTTFTLDPVHDPKHIDVVRQPTEQEEELFSLARKLGKDVPEVDARPMPGIYSLGGGDQIALCMALPGAERPTEFVTSKGDKLIVMLFKRVKE